MLTNGCIYCHNSLGPEVAHSKFTPLTLQMAKDPVPNVRFSVARTLHTLIAHIDSSVVQKQIKPCLLSLSEDSDRDVQYFASQALQAC